MNEKRLLCEARKVAANDMQSAATREWDFDRQGVHAGHYHMENYDAAKLDFAVRAGLIKEQHLFSDEQLAVIKNACEFALEDDATLSYEQLVRVL